MHVVETVPQMRHDDADRRRYVKRALAFHVRYIIGALSLERQCEGSANRVGGELM